MSLPSLPFLTPRETGELSGLVQRASLAGAVRISVASRSATPPTRLETRTKESNMCASRRVVTKLLGVVKAKTVL